jgi:hypothetical protein
MQSVAVQAMNASAMSFQPYTRLYPHLLDPIWLVLCVLRGHRVKVRAFWQSMAGGAAESVASTNYYTEITVSERNKGRKWKVGVTREQQGVDEHPWFSG